VRKERLRGNSREKQWPKERTRKRERARKRESEKEGERARESEKEKREKKKETERKRTARPFPEGCPAFGTIACGAATQANEEVVARTRVARYAARVRHPTAAAAAHRDHACLACPTPPAAVHVRARVGCVACRRAARTARAAGLAAWHHMQLEALLSPEARRDAERDIVGTPKIKITGLCSC